MSDVSKNYARALEAIETADLEDRDGILEAIRAMVESTNSSRTKAQSEAQQLRENLTSLRTVLGIESEDTQEILSGTQARLSQLQEQLKSVEGERDSLKSEAQRAARKLLLTEVGSRAGIARSGQLVLEQILPADVELAIEDGKPVVKAGNTKTELQEYLQAEQFQPFLPAIFADNSPAPKLPVGGVKESKPATPDPKQAVNRVLSGFAAHLPALKGNVQ